MAVQRGESVAVVDAHIVSIASGVILGDRHRPRQCGADRRAGRDSQVHAGVSSALAGDGVDAVTEFRGNTAFPS